MPNGKFDDRCDAMSQCLIRLGKNYAWIDEASQKDYSTGASDEIINMFWPKMRR